MIGVYAKPERGAGRPCRRLPWIALGVCLLFNSACYQQPPAGSAGESQPTFREQVDSVRAGTSKTIRCDHVLVRDDDIKQLAGLEDKLVRLNLSHTEITDDGLALIASMPLLQQLRISSPRITDAGLVSLHKLSRLRFLHLMDMPITDAGLEHLEQLTSLESLYLDRIQATDEGIARLVAALPGVHLHIDGDHHRLDPRVKTHQH